MFRLALRDPDGDRVAAVVGARRKIVQMHAQNGEIVERRGDIRVLIAEHAALHRERFEIQRFGFGVTVHAIERACMRRQRGRQQRMIGRQQSAIDRRRFFERRQRLGGVAVLHAERAEIDQIFRDVDMVFAVQRAEHRQRFFGERGAFIEIAHIAVEHGELIQFAGDVGVRRGELRARHRQRLAHQRLGFFEVALTPRDLALQNEIARDRCAGIAIVASMLHECGRDCFLGSRIVAFFVLGAAEFGQQIGVGIIASPRRAARRSRAAAMRWHDRIVRVRHRSCPSLRRSAPPAAVDWPVAHRAVARRRRARRRR